MADKLNSTQLQYIDAFAQWACDVATVDSAESIAKKSVLDDAYKFYDFQAGL
jgi:hypothetical protein